MKEIINLTNDQFIDFADGGNSFCELFYQLGIKFGKCYGAASDNVWRAYERRKENNGMEEMLAIDSFTAGYTRQRCGLA